MDQHEQLQCSTAAEEVDVFLVGKIDTLCRRMDLQRPGSFRRATIQLTDCVGPLGIYRNAWNHRFGIAGYDLEQIVVGHVEMGSPPVSLAALVVDGILSQDDRFGETGLPYLLRQRQHIAFVERCRTPPEPQFPGQEAEQQPFGLRR